MKIQDILLVVFVMMIWGVNFSAIKTGVSQFDPLLIAAARFFFASFPLIFFVKRPKVGFRYFIAYGLVFGTGVWGMASCSITLGLSSGMAGILLQTNVLTSILLGVLLYKELITRAMAAGMVLALSGLVLAIVSENGNVTALGAVCIFISALCWPVVGAIVRASQTKEPFAFNIWGMAIAPLPLLGLSLSLHGVEGFTFTASNWNLDAWFSVLFQAYPTTVFGYWVWSRMILKYPMSRLAPFTLLTSVFALLSGLIFFDESLSPYQWGSCILFLLGIIIATMPGSVLKKPFDLISKQARVKFLKV